MTRLRWVEWKVRLLDAAEITDAWRIVPRLALFGYADLCWELSQWYMALKDPTAQQMAFVTVIVGLAALILNFYMQTGRTWK
jgi:hypothetical protein